MPRRRDREDIRKLKDRLPHPEYNDLARAFSVCLQPVEKPYLNLRHQYEYEFRAAPRQKDPVIRLIRNVISELNRSREHGLLMSNHNIRVMPTTTAAPMWPPGRNNDNIIKFYTFYQDMVEFPASIPVAITPRVWPLTADKVHVRLDGGWVPIKQWLIDLADESILNKRSASSITYFWHKRGGLHFRLMDLPPELRLMIFEYVVAPYGEVYPLSLASTPLWKDQKTTQEIENAHVVLGVGYHSKDSLASLDEMLVQRSRGSRSSEVRPPTAAPELALLHVSKQVKEEALQAGWESSTRCFKDAIIFTAVCDSKVGVATRFDVLGHIRLDFTVGNWFEFFGLQVDPHLHQDESASLAPYLARLKDTCILEFRFNDPEDGYHDNDPWFADATMCQTHFIDWIMAFSFQHIIQVKRIKLMGYIKRPQREKWLDVICRHKGEGDFKFDYTTAIHAILNTPANDLPPRCVCRKDCRCFEYSRRQTVGYGRYERSFYYRGTTFDFEDGED